MYLKNYQKRTLDTLSAFFSAAKLLGIEEAFEKYREASGYNANYRAIDGLEDVPYICLRLPTGGGKTLIGTHSISIAAEKFLEQEFPIVIWLVPTDVIRQQTLKILRDSSQLNRKALDEALKGQVKIFDVTEFNQLLPQDLSQSVNIFVATFQSFRVDKKDGRKVYDSEESLEPLFKDIQKQNYFDVDENDTWYSFRNLIAYCRPLMIVDEAHNHKSELSVKIMQRLRPSVIIELTATPEKISNVLCKVSALELKSEDMIKLPIELAEIKLSWQQTIENAVQKRAQLEKIADNEPDYVRPIVLYQAESKDKDLTVDVVQKFLIEDVKVPAEEIVIATGEQRGLDKVENLLDRDCKIRHIITVQALKEGWDCPFAYVFCSVAKVHSPKDAEQLLGRVLRMPYAKRRNSAKLNKAYAYFDVNDWQQAVRQMTDDLTNMGFEEQEIKAAIQQPKLFDGGNAQSGSENIFEDNSPSSRGVKFEVPQLCLDFGSGARVASRSDFLGDWKLTEKFEPVLPTINFDVEQQIYEIDVDGQKITKKLSQ